MMTVQEWQWERNRSINRKTKQSGKGDVSQKGRDSGQGWKNGSWLERVRKPRLALGFPKASRLQWRSSQVPDTQGSWVSEIWTPTSLPHYPWGQGAPNLLSRRRLELTTWEKRNQGAFGTQTPNPLEGTGTTLGTGLVWKSQDWTENVPRPLLLPAPWCRQPEAPSLCPPTCRRMESRGCDSKETTEPRRKAQTTNTDSQVSCRASPWLVPLNKAPDIKPCQRLQGF